MKRSPRARGTLGAFLVPLGAATFAGPADASAPPTLVTAGLRTPGIRVLVIRAGGDDHRWQDFPQLPGLAYRVLETCTTPPDVRTACDPDGGIRRALALEPGRASAWTWQGARVAYNAAPDAIENLVGEHLGPRPRVWLDGPNPERRAQLRRGLNDTGVWQVTHRIQDITAVRRLDESGPAVTKTCPDRRPPALSVLRVADGRGTWVDVARRCRAVVATGDTPQALIRALMDRWRLDDPPPVGPSPLPALGAGPPPAGRALDHRLRAAIADSRAALDRIAVHGTDPQLVAAARAWIGVAYRRDGTTSTGVDDIHLAREIYRDAYGLELPGEPIDWLQRYKKIPVDEARPEALLRPGDILFKVTLSYRPREVSIYLGADAVVVSAPVKGVVVEPVPRKLSDKYYLVARRPSPLVRGR